MITEHIQKELRSNKDKWRKILKTLFLIEHILRTGGNNFLDAMRGCLYQIKSLNSFKYIDESRNDKGETSIFY